MRKTAGQEDPAAETSSPLLSMLKPHGQYQIAILGSGNWGSAIAKLVGENVGRQRVLFKPTVRMWVYEEDIEGEKLTDIINTRHENVKYLPSVFLPRRVVAVPDAVETVKDADLLIFAVPHQFLKGLVAKLKGNIKPGAIAISLIKGIDFDENGPLLLSDHIANELNIDVSVLMGANVAWEVALSQFCETTIGSKNSMHAALWYDVFNTRQFRVRTVPQVAAVELCGALKNIVALGAGLCDGLGYGNNSKSAIMRLGFHEMKRFIDLVVPDVPSDIYLESCGFADLITTCFGGRNRKVAEAFVKTPKDIAELERELLGGQKLQGLLTAEDVHTVLEKKGLLSEFPLFTNIYDIFFKGEPPSSVIDVD